MFEFRYNETDLIEDEGELRQKLAASETALEDLENALGDVELELEQLAERKQEFIVLDQVCNSLELLDDIGAAHLFWED